MDIPVIEQAKIQAQVLVPLVTVLLLFRDGSTPLLQLPFNQKCHVFEETYLLRAEVAGPNVEDAERAHTASTYEQRAARVKSHPHFS